MAGFCTLEHSGLIAIDGDDAAAFLQAQLTSDVTALAPQATQYSGYCSAQGRLIATFLLWRRRTDLLLQLPKALAPAVQTRLTRYVLRSRVRLTDAGAQHIALGLAGPDAESALREAGVGVPDRAHAIAQAADISVARLPGDRFLLVVRSESAERLIAALSPRAERRDENWWHLLDIAAGVPVITPETQERYVPQMVNLDLVGGVSFSKGCYPGQEIVARTHFLGRLKQRMYRLHVPIADTVAPGDPLYSVAFGADQASGVVLNAARRPDHTHEALAVVQIAAKDSPSLHFKSSDGPALQFLPLPYTLPA